MRAIDIIMSKKFGRGKKGMVIGWPELLKVAGGTATDIVGATPPITLEDAIKGKIIKLTQYGLCTQADTPTPSSPVDIMCNNGALQMVDDELPAGYKRVLGFALNNNSYWEIADFPLYGSDTLRFSFEASDACNVIGAYSGSASGNNYSLYVGSSSNYLRYKNGAYNSAVEFDTRYDVEISPTGSSGMKVNSTWTAQSFTTPTNLCIGTTATSASSAKLKGKLNGNIEVVGRLKLIPCERVSDNELGYYDLIGKAFHEQASGYKGAVSLGYDGSHYSLAVVGTDEVLTIGTTETTRETIVPEQTIVWASSSYSLPSSCVDPLLTFIKGDTAIVTVDGVETTVTITSTGSNPSASSYWVTVPLPNSWSVTADGHDSTAKVYFGSTPKESSTHTLKIEKATTTTEIFSTASVPNLFAVGNYADEIEIISGGITRKVGITILTGEETGWALSDSGSTHRFRGVKPSDCHTPASRAPSICTHFKYVSTGSAVGGMFIGASQYWYFIPTDQTIDTVEKWKSWLAEQYAAGTPVVVIYPLAEETTESVTPQPLKTAEGDNTISVTANVSPIEFDVTYMKGA